MMKLSLICLCLAFHLATAGPGHKSYKGYQVLGTRPLRDSSDVSAVWSVLEDPRYVPWSRPSVGREVLIMTSPQHLPHLTHLLHTINMQPYTSIQDVHKLLETERNEIEGIKGFRTTTFQQNNVTFDTYMELHEIDAYLDEVVLTFPKVASLEVIGHSYEGRPLRVLKLSSSQNTSESKPVVFIDAGIHAREWLTPPTALHIVYQLTVEAERNQDMLDQADWYILAVANPDGYLFTWDQDRFWRKNRRENKNSTCFGVDLNRNFDVAWKGTGNDYTDPCSTYYSGTTAQSEPEAKAIADFLISKTEHLSLYMAIHSHGSYLLYPFGYKNDTPDASMIRAAEDAATQVEAVRGTKFKVGSIANMLYYAYGSSQDFAYGKLNVTFSYTWELPSGGSIGFDPPSSEIRPVIEEVWVGFKVLFYHAMGRVHDTRTETTEEIVTETIVNLQDTTTEEIVTETSVNLQDTTTEEIVTDSIVSLQVTTNKEIGTETTVSQQEQSVTERA